MIFWINNVYTQELSSIIHNTFKRVSPWDIATPKRIHVLKYRRWLYWYIQSQIHEYCVPKMSYKMTKINMISDNITKEKVTHMLHIKFYICHYVL
jgi:hypothetical protein